MKFLLVVYYVYSSGHLAELAHSNTPLPWQQCQLAGVMTLQAMIEHDPSFAGKLAIKCIKDVRT